MRQERDSALDWHNNILSLIDLRSFSNIWYWIALAVLWSSLSHYVMGVPFDMVVRARKRGGAALEDLEALVRVQVNRRVHIAEVAGPWLVALGAAGLTMLALLGFVYRIQFGQALFLLMAPGTLVGLMSVAAARRLARAPLQGEPLCAFLSRQRLWIQLLGVASIFITAIWGMLQVMTTSALGGG